MVAGKKVAFALSGCMSRESIAWARCIHKKIGCLSYLSVLRVVIAEGHVTFRDGGNPQLSLSDRLEFSKRTLLFESF